MTLHKINLQNEDNIADAPTIFEFNRWIHAVFPASQPSYELTLRVVDHDEGTTLNETYRPGKKGPTNVLSFPFEENAAMPEAMLAEQEHLYLGDIVFCAPVIIAEAKKQNKALTAHWCHLTIHGCLHLLGYDHIEPKDAKEMEGEEIAILTELGYDNPYEDNPA